MADRPLCRMLYRYGRTQSAARILHPTLCRYGPSSHYHYHLHSTSAKGFASIKILTINTDFTISINLTTATDFNLTTDLTPLPPKQTHQNVLLPRITLCMPLPPPRWYTIDKSTAKTTVGVAAFVEMVVRFMAIVKSVLIVKLLVLAKSLAEV